MSTLLLRLGGPLQSWGSSSVYDRRDTDDMPTKSAVIGMVAAALGRKRGDPLDDLAALEFGVRIDQPGRRINDFQITDMGESSTGNKLNKNLSTRVYLSDAIFLVGLSTEKENFLEEISEALNHPVFPLFLGRRSCPPTLPLNLGIRQENLCNALRNEPWQASEWSKKRILNHDQFVYLRIITDATEDHGAIKKDVPVSFSPYRRQYRYRYIMEIDAKVIKENDKMYETEHDPMMEL